MKRALIALALGIASISAAYSMGLGLGTRFDRLGAGSKRGLPAAPQPTGNITIVDGTSLILQTDGASTICRAGGC